VLFRSPSMDLDSGLRAAKRAAAYQTPVLRLSWEGLASARGAEDTEAG
jgi:hypothetical protein